MGYVGISQFDLGDLIYIDQKGTDRFRSCASGPSPAFDIRHCFCPVLFLLLQGIRVVEMAVLCDHRSYGKCHPSPLVCYGTNQPGQCYGRHSEQPHPNFCLDRWPIVFWKYHQFQADPGYHIGIWRSKRFDTEW